MSRTRIGEKIQLKDFINQTGEESSSQCLVKESMRSLSTSGKDFIKSNKARKIQMLIIQVRCVYIRLLEKNIGRQTARAVRRRHCGGGGGRVNFGRRRRRRAAGPKKSAAAARRGRPKKFFSKIHEKISFYSQNFLRNFLVI